MMHHARDRECIHVRVHARARVHAGGRECVRARIHDRVRVHARARAHTVIMTVAVKVRGHDPVHNRPELMNGLNGIATYTEMTTAGQGKPDDARCS
jgi:hypothetical protein